VRILNRPAAVSSTEKSLNKTERIHCHRKKGGWEGWFKRRSKSEDLPKIKYFTTLTFEEGEVVLELSRKEA